MLTLYLNPTDGISVFDTKEQKIIYIKNNDTVPAHLTFYFQRGVFILRDKVIEKYGLEAALAHMRARKPEFDDKATGSDSDDDNAGNY